jgi:hypothetical protein
MGKLLFGFHHGLITSVDLMAKLPQLLSCLITSVDFYGKTSLE